MLNLGRLLIVFLTPIVMFAGVKAYFSHDKIYKGDQVQLIIESSEENTQFPEIDSIGGFDVAGVSSSQNISIANGDRSVVITKKYSFYPTKSITVEPIDIAANGKSFTTKKISLKVVPPKQTKDPLYSFTISSETKEAYVGESFLVKLEFEYDERLSLANLYFDSGNLNSVLVKELHNNWKQTNSLRRLKYSNEILVTPTKEGELNLGEQQIVAEFNQRDRMSIFGRNVQKRVYSNPLKINILPIPSGAKLIGDFEINAKVDKREIDAKEAVTVTYEVIGAGDLESFELALPQIEGVTLFEDKSTFNFGSQKGKFLSKKSFKGAYVSDSDFTIPPVEVTYFDKKSGKIVTKQSQSFPIKVRGKSVAQKSNEVVLADEKLESEKESVNGSSGSNYLYLALGVVIGILLSLLPKIKLRKEEKSEGVQYGYGDKRELYRQLLSLDYDKDVKIALKDLEDEIYSGKKATIKTKDIKKLIREKLAAKE